MNPSRTLPRAETDEPTAFELLESVLTLISGVVIAAPMLPGFTLCVPMLAAVAIALLVPTLVAALLATTVGVVVAIPFLLIRFIGSIPSRRASRRAAHAPMSTPIPVIGSRAAGETMVHKA